MTIETPVNGDTEMRILLAEDEEVTAAVLCGKLTSMGHDVTVATDGLSAWRLLQKEHFPLVITDWMMPGLDGPTLCRRIRAVGDSPYTYIILVSVRDRRTDRMKGLQAGADDFLVKPFEVEDLAVRLEIARMHLLGPGAAGATGTPTGRSRPPPTI